MRISKNIISGYCYLILQVLNKNKSDEQMNKTHILLRNCKDCNIIET